MKRSQFAPLLLAAAAALLSGVAQAQGSGTANPAPARVEPPPPPEMSPLDPALEPEIVIRPGDNKETIKEYRLNGRVYMVEVIPLGGGEPYYLVDDQGDGKFSRHEPLDNGLRVPRWIFKTF